MWITINMGFVNTLYLEHILGYYYSLMSPQRLFTTYQAYATLFIWNEKREKRS